MSHSCQICQPTENSDPSEDLPAPSPDSTAASRIQLNMTQHLIVTWTVTFVISLACSLDMKELVLGKYFGIVLLIRVLSLAGPSVLKLLVS